MLLQTAVQFLRALRIQATPHEAVHGIPTDRLAFSKTWSADVDIALLAVSEVFSRPKNRVCQYTRRIVAKASSIGFNGCLQRGAFVERIPSQILYAEIAVDNAHFNLGAKLDRGSLLSPYDWSHPRLAQTDNALVDPMCSFFEHFFLLCIEHFYYRKPFLQFCRKLLPQFFIRRMDHFQVASQIPELLSHRFSDHLL